VVEPRDVQFELSGIHLKVVVSQRLLAMEEQLVHLPKPALECSSLGRCCRGEGVRVDLHEREVPERETDSTAHFLLDALDRPKGLSREGTFVVAVLEDDMTRRRAPDTVENVVERLDAAPTLLRDGVTRHQNPTYLSNEDNVNAAGEFLVDLEGLV
jgi:hypothetical protein